MKTSSFRSITAALATCLAVVGGGIAPAQAADPTQFFELDGNILPGSAAGPDWSDIFQPSSPAGATPKAPLPAGFSSATFVLDFNPTGNNDNSTYATGSKDTLNITPGWQCVKSNNVNDKTDINNAYAVAYTADVSGTPHLIVYFALDVAANEGTKNVAFWFLKDPTVGCVAGNKATDFIGNHSDGDVLIVSEYTSGGRVSTIKAYRWVGGANGFLDTTPVGTGGDCQDGPFDVCARTNAAVLNGDGATPDVPWAVKTKTSNPQGSGYNSARDLDVGEFFEGGIDLTALGISGCFNRYLADTRSSTSLTATIFDYALGNFANCSIGASKACVGTTVNTATNDFTSTFTATITNTSPAGNVHDVSFNEAANAIPSGESCTITSNTGDQNVNGTVLTNGGTPVKVTSSLAPNAGVTVGISCTGPANGFQNAIEASAGSAPGQSDITRSATSDACSAAVSGGLTINKVCRGMSLQVSGSSIALRADVEVTVGNPAASNQNVQIDTVTDTKVASFTQVNCATKQPIAADLLLSPNESACFTGNYSPTAGDLGGQSAPSTAVFKDTASATAHGAINNAPFTAQSAEVSCYLCDADVDGSPDVIDCLTDPQCNAPH